MAAGTLDLGSESHTDRYPLLMESMSSSSDQGHVVVNVSTENPPLSSSTQGDVSTTVDSQDRTLPTSSRTPSQPVPSTLSSRSTSFPRSGDLHNYGRRQRASPLNSGLWISIELTITLSQIIASIIVLSLSRNEKPQAPLSVWVVGYAAGCLATLPLLYWRYTHRYIRVPDQDPLSSSIGSHSSPPASPRSTPYTAISIPQASEEETQNAFPSEEQGHFASTSSSRLSQERERPTHLSIFVRQISGSNPRGTHSLPMEEHRDNVGYSHSTQTTSSSDRGFSEFLHTAASAVPSGGGATSSPPSGGHSAAAGRKKPSPGEILSSAKVIVDAAKAKMHHGEDQASEAQRIDKAKVAAAAGDILSAAKHYGKLDEKNYGKYVQKAEEYLHSYNVKHSTEGVAVNSSTPTPPSHSSAQTTHEENKYGKYFKKAEEYLNKH